MTDFVLIIDLKRDKPDDRLAKLCATKCCFFRPSEAISGDYCRLGGKGKNEELDAELADCDGGLGYYFSPCTDEGTVIATRMKLGVKIHE